MKVVILCGGEGTRLREYTEAIPKPLVEVGGKPILWHIMKIYAHHGFKEFILCLGYKGEKIKEYFSAHNPEHWKITFVETGEKSNKAERLMKVKDLIKEEQFLLAYGDDVSDVDITKAVQFHKTHGKTVTMTAINPESQFGVLKLEGDKVSGFIEKPKLDTWINGGFFIMSPKIFSYLKQGNELEDQTFKELAQKGEIIAYKHKGFWKCMNVFKDVVELNDLWQKKSAPWKVWED